MFDATLMNASWEPAILQRHRGPTPNVMIWGTIGYNMRSCLLRIEGNLNSNRYIREVLYPEVLLIQTTQHAIFQKHNSRPHVARIVQAFIQRRRISLLPWPSCSPDMSGIRLVGDLFVEVLQHLLLTLCGLAYTLRVGTFPRKISRASLIPCNDA